GYSCTPPARVLEETGRLQKDVRARIDETAQFVFDVTSPGGLAPGGVGVQSCQKVRLIHGLIRHRIRSERTFDEARYGAPINQEDLASTVLAFGHVTAHAIEVLGQSLSERERDGWLHLWRVVGSLLGTEDDALPDGAVECEALFRRVLQRHQA